MKTIDLARGAPALPALLELASEENVILRTQDGREFVLAEIVDFEREVALARQNEELMEFLDHRSAPGPKWTIEEVRKMLEAD